MIHERSAARVIDGTMGFLVPGHRHHLTVRPHGGPGATRELAVDVSEVDGHPFDVGPFAVLDRDAVAELHLALGTWLAEGSGELSS